MQEWAATLLELQDLDIKMAKLEEQLAQVPIKIKGAQSLYQAESDAFDDAKKAAQDASLAIRNIEKEADAIREQKRSFQSKTAMIKNNDDYKAALIQIEMCEHAISDLEDKQLEAMEQLDIVQQRLKEKTDSLTEAKHRAEGVCEDLEIRRKNCTEQIKILTAKRPALAAAVDKDILSKYERLRAARNNVRTRPCFVPIIDGACGRCRMKVTDQAVSDTRKGLVVHCGSCSAILYNL